MKTCGHAMWSRTWYVLGRSFPSCLVPSFQSGASCATFRMKMSFTWSACEWQLIFIWKVLKKRYTSTRKSGLLRTNGTIGCRDLNRPTPLKSLIPAFWPAFFPYSSVCYLCFVSYPLSQWLFSQRRLRWCHLFLSSRMDWTRLFAVSL